MSRQFVKRFQFVTRLYVAVGVAIHMGTLLLRRCCGCSPRSAAEFADSRKPSARCARLLSSCTLMYEPPFSVTEHCCQIYAPVSGILAKHTTEASSPTCACEPGEAK